MGFLSNTVNFCQFKTTGAVPSDQYEFFKEKLQQHAFVSIDNIAAELSTGWVDMFDQSNAIFGNPGQLYLDHYMCFSLRQDRRRIPGAVLKEQMKIKCEEYLVAHPGLSRVPRQKREEIHEAVKTVLLARTLPCPSVCDVVWDLSTGIITFCNISRNALDTFDTLFRRTFPDFSLRLITPYDHALAIADSQGLAKSMQTANKANSESILDLLTSNQWIGQDLLLYLLYVQGSDGVFTRPEVTAYIDQRLILCGSGDSGIQKITFAGNNDKFEAIRSALLEGKQITEARIVLEVEEEIYALTLKGQRFDFASYKCPAVHIEQTDDALSEQQAVFFERVYLFDKGQALFKHLFAEFLKCRLSPEWQETLSAIQIWLNGD